MRGTVAKRLRRKAETATVGLPEKEYEIVRGRSKGKSFSSARLVECTRSTYKAMKAEYKANV